MGNVYKQKGSIVLYKEERNGTDYIRIEYANSPTVALLLAYDEGIETTGSGWAYMEAASFKPVDFHKRYSPYAFIDYNKVYLWGKTNEKDVIEAADRISALVQGYDYGTNFVPFMAGMSAVRAAYAVTTSSLSEEVFENDGQTDSDKWDAAFLASLSYLNSATL